MDANKLAEQFTTVGDVAPLQSVHAIVYYDPEDGQVRHIHHVFVLKGGRPFDLAAVQQEAFVQAEAFGHRMSSLKALHVADLRDVRATYRVDLERKVLSRIPRSTRVTRAGHLD